MTILCIACQSPDIEEVVKENYRYFYCSHCHELHERALNPDYGRDITIPTRKGLCHLVAGGLLRKDDRFLLLKRRIYAFGYSFPAGHVEYQEKPFETLKREIMEETALQIKKGELIFEGEVTNHKCRYGADIHYWYFYDCDYRASPIVLNPESEAYGWYTLQEALKLDLVPQARFIMNRLSSDERIT
jgi:8-oxo-dGTP pyrophosphatase MutT (NUDIX family)